MKQNRNLNPVELEQANSVLGEVRTRLNALAAGDTLATPPNAEQGCKFGNRDAGLRPD